MTVGSSVGARVEVIEVNEQEQAQNEERNFEEGVFVSSKVSRRLCLNSASEKEEAHENSDLMQLEDGSKVEGNGTITKKKDENTKDAESNGGSGEEMSKDNKEPWVNMFKNNRVANNGMQLNYFPPQIVNGETMVQLEGKEVLDEEAKWKCALIAYVVGECPAYNVMNRYIMMNWSKAGKPTLFLHEEGYFIVKFQNMEDMNEILFLGPYTINNRPIIVKQWCSDFDFGKEFLA